MNPEFLRQKMIAAGYNPNSLSLAAGPTRDFIRCILDGRVRDHSASRLRAVGRVLGLTVEELLDGQPEAEASPPPATDADWLIATMEDR